MLHKSSEDLKQFPSIVQAKHIFIKSRVDVNWRTLTGQQLAIKRVFSIVYRSHYLFWNLTKNSGRSFLLSSIGC